MASRMRETTAQVKFVVDGEGKVKAVFNGVAADAGKSSEAVENLSKELLTLTERVDKAAAKSNQLARDRTVLDEALRRGLITQERHNELLKKSADRYDELSAKAKVAGAIIGTALVAGLVLVARETIQAEQQQAQLAAVLKSTGEAAGLTQRQLNAMADDLATKSIFSAGDITEAQTRLLSYSGILGENIPRAMQIVIDQSARLGISLTQSAETIGRALESPSKAAAALAQQGFGASFTAEVRETIKALEDAGREAEAQAVVMDILEESYAGAAQAARDTLGGAVAALKNNFLDLLTGDSGSDGVRGATDAINDLADLMNDESVKAGFATMISGLAEIVSLSAEAVTGLANMSKWLGETAARAQGFVSLDDVGGTRDRLDKVNAELAARNGGLSGARQRLDNLIPNWFHPLRSVEEARLSLSSDDALAAEKAKLEGFIRLQEQLAGLGRNARAGGASGPAGASTTGAPTPGSAEAVAEFTRRVEALRAELGGPLAQAQLAYNRELAQFRDLAAKGKISSEELKAVEADLAEQYRRNAEEIRNRPDAAASRAAARAARERAQAERELQAALEKVVAAQDEFHRRAQDLRAELEGPLAQAQLAYDRELERFRDLAAQGEIGAAELAAAEADLAEQHRRTTEELQRRMNPAAELIRHLDEELRLRTLNNAEARAAIDLANLAVPATKAEAAAILERYKALQAQADVADAMDAFRNSSKSAFKDFATGAETALGAAEAFFDRLWERLFDLVQDRIWEQLFGSQGSTNGGSAGGAVASLFGNLFGGGGGGGGTGNTSTSVLNPITGEMVTSGAGGGESGAGIWGTVASFFGAIFGGGRASGGDTLPGHFYRVNEHTPELLEWNGQTLLMMGNQRGNVRPLQAAGAGGPVYNITVPVTGQVDRRTRSQIGADTARAIRRDQARNA